MGTRLAGIDVGALDNDALRQLVASLGKEIDALNEKLAPVGSTSNATKLSPKEAAVGAQALPNELFLVVAKFLNPGTKSLLNLARATTKLYMLLLPRLYETISLDRLLRNKVGGTRLQPAPQAMSGRNFVLPNRFAKVKHLDTYLGSRRGKRRLFLSDSCVNVTSLCCDWESFATLLDLEYCRPNLESLEIYVSGAWMTPRPQTWDESGASFPKLRDVKYRGYPDFTIMAFIGQDLPQVERISVEFDQAPRSPLQLPHLFVAKIRSVEFSAYNVLPPIITNFPCFAPRIISTINSWIQRFTNMTINLQQWLQLCRLDSLETLRLDTIDTSYLLLDFPWGLKHIRFHNLCLKVRGRENLEELDRVLTAALGNGIEIAVTCDPRMTETDGDLHGIEAELEVWSKVPGFRVEEVSLELEDDEDTSV